VNLWIPAYAGMTTDFVIPVKTGIQAHYWICAGSALHSRSLHPLAHAPVDRRSLQAIGVQQTVPRIVCCPLSRK